MQRPLPIMHAHKKFIILQTMIAKASPLSRHTTSREETRVSEERILQARWLPLSSMGLNVDTLEVFFFLFIAFYFKNKKQSYGQGHIGKPPSTCKVGLSQLSLAWACPQAGSLSHYRTKNYTYSNTKRPQLYEMESNGLKIAVAGFRSCTLSRLLSRCAINFIYVQALSSKKPLIQSLRLNMSSAKEK